MSAIIDNVSPVTFIMISTLFLFIVVLFILMVVMINKITVLEMKYKKFMKNKDGLSSIEDLIFRCIEEIDFVKQEYSLATNRLSALENTNLSAIQKISVMRYNVFENVGSDQSFSVAMLDKKNTGVIITGLYTREGTTTYAKPINEGTCTYLLSNEEKEVLEKTMKK